MQIENSITPYEQGSSAVESKEIKLEIQISPSRKILEYE